MANPRLAARYAKSLIDLATELNQLDNVYADMKWLQSIDASNPDFTAVLRSPVIKPGTKQKIINAIVTSKVSNVTASFIGLLVRKGRESNLTEIANAFVEQFNQIKNIYKVKLTTATPISDDVRSTIIAKIKSSTPLQNIEMETEVRDELIGGFLLEMEGTLVDASILKDLRDIQKQFMDNQYLHKLR